VAQMLDFTNTEIQKDGETESLGDWRAIPGSLTTYNKLRRRFPKDGTAFVGCMNKHELCEQWLVDELIVDTEQIETTEDGNPKAFTAFKFSLHGLLDFDDLYRVYEKGSILAFGSKIKMLESKLRNCLTNTDLINKINFHIADFKWLDTDFNWSCSVWYNYSELSPNPLIEWRYYTNSTSYGIVWLEGTDRTEQIIQNWENVKPQLLQQIRSSIAIRDQNPDTD